MRVSKKSEKSDLIDVLRDLLFSKEISTQEGLCKRLNKQGFDVDQSKVSRLLRKLGAIKVRAADGQQVYCLNETSMAPSTNSALSHLVIEVLANDVMLVVRTSPGSASLIGSVIDRHRHEINILGTVAGDDTVLVIPKSIKQTKSVLQAIKKILTGV